MVIIPQMDALFLEPDVECNPPEKTRLVEVRALPNPDGRRIRIWLELTPFQKSPIIDISLVNPMGEVCSAVTIIEPAGWKLEFNLHIRMPEPIPGDYILNATASFPEHGEIDRREIHLNILSPSDQ